MNLGISKKFIKIALLLSLAISFTIHFSLIAGFLFENDIDRHDFTIGFIAFELFSTFLVGIVLFLVNHHFYKPFDLHSKLTLKKFFYSTFLTFLVTIILILILTVLRNPFDFEVHSRRHSEILFSRNLFCAGVVLISIFIMRLVFQKQAIELENEKLKSESLQSQFESLKNQMSPHFLFNSLTALKTLIDETPAMAGLYVNHLSQVLRHSLQSHKKELVKLKEEIELTQSYIFLLKIRYGANLSVEIDIEKKYHHFEIPPLTIQNLVENAVKHNEISKEYPLLIVIQTMDNGNLQVKNIIQEKLTNEEGTGIGLSNLIRLYHLLGEDGVQISQVNQEFIVEVPLIKLKNYESAHN